MYIESIKLQGFKSFRGEADLTFPHKITAIVGPNGSGKSNIADAFRWVLGEQSLKAVRSQESTDVIFSGSASQGKLSRAFVSIHFAIEKNAKGAIKGLSELAIARKLYRNGESSYTLNGKDVRRLDVHLQRWPEKLCRNWPRDDRRRIKTKPKRSRGFFLRSHGRKKASD
jgi:chromosome segregation protein